MTELNLTPKFKYSTLLCCQIRHILSIYIPTRARSVRENDYPAQGWNPTSVFFRTLNKMVHYRLEPYTKVQNRMLLCCQNRDIFNVYRANRARSVLKMINMFRFGTPQPFFFKNWTQWCMPDLNLTPYLKYSTILCCQNRDIFSMDIPTIANQFKKMINVFRVRIPSPIFPKNI